ncbi:MAG: hypothetical protein CL933_07060 [Deltaproteobacteria bacterium]|nr:hypothetical protein [Deltaproteobacteria bacterium]
MPSRPITRLLVANRGEIARRIMRSAHAMGIRSVAMYAEGDADAPFVREADAAIALAGRAAGETYLDMDKIIAAALRSDADAIHPGYGFLSENATFARRVREAGLVFVGPSSEAIAAMGDKLSAKKRMMEVGLPTLPSEEIPVGAEAGEVAARIGYPLLVKASAGGGGRGMRVVHAEADLAESLESARREAVAAFGEGTLFLERWLPSTRHVEIQVLGDEHGNLVHCFERECSIQRRHQKLIEEAPSPAVTPELRERIGAAALIAAKSIGYSSAGTVEFLLEQGTAEPCFWFLEMNTRLQVEHPVTEAICGLDLVREQLRIAQGEALGFNQADLAHSGHAIEARLYAEDPNNDFLPAAGTVLAWQPAADVPARIDSGIEVGSSIGIEFDPLLAKLIVHAPTRREAALSLARVLETTRIQGVITNREFLATILRHEAFLAGDTTTDFIETRAPARNRPVAMEDLHSAAIAAALLAQSSNREQAQVLTTHPSGWRNTHAAAVRRVFRDAKGRALSVCYSARRDGDFEVVVEGETALVRIREIEAERIDLEIDGVRRRFDIVAQGVHRLIHGAQFDLVLRAEPRFPEFAGEDSAGGLTAQMPGRVLSVNVSVGDRVVTGQLLLVLEAMKMEHRITAPHDGTVSELRVVVDDQVESGSLLAEISEEDPH